MTNPVHDNVLETLNQNADEAILSSLKDPALREHVRGFSHPQMVRNLAKPGADIKADLTFIKFLNLLTACTAVINRGNELDAVKKVIIYNKAGAEAEVAKLPSSQGLAVAFDALTAEKAHLLHMAVGLAGEASEMLEAIVKHVLGSELDVDNVREEAGDSAFYLQGIIGSDSVGFGLRQALLANKVKLLGKRYKDGYSDQAAQARADKAPGQ